METDDRFQRTQVSRKFGNNEENEGVNHTFQQVRAMRQLYSWQIQGHLKVITVSFCFQMMETCT
jgi:hypothetical protein